MSVRHALLALLVDGPRYGYQLKMEFERATGQAWSLNIGQVYSTLQRLERDKLIKADGPPDHEGRQSYLLTPSGNDEVDAWLSEPLATPGTSRDDLAIKVLVSLAATQDRGIDVVAAQRLAAMGQLQALTARKVAGHNSTNADLAAQLQLDRTILMAEAQIRWLDLVEQRVEASGEQANPAEIAVPVDDLRGAQ